MPLVLVTLYDNVKNDASFRMLNVNISHGDTIIKDNSGISPLITKIKLDLALVTNIENKMNVPGLRSKPPVEWY